MFEKTQISSENRHKFIAYLGRNTNWWNYYSDYKTTIDHLAECVENGVPINTISLPLLFLIRHALELGFKANILKFESVNSEIPNLSLGGSNSHSLEFLYSRFKEHLKEIQDSFEIDPSISQQIDLYFEKFDKLIQILHDMDSRSLSFRYPIDKKGSNSFEWDQEVNVADIVSMFYDLQPFLVFSDKVLYEQGVFGLE